MSRLGLLATLAALLPASAVAGPVFDRVSGPEGARLCFARVYDAAHLSRNPAQRVTTISLARDRTAPASENNRRRFTLALSLRTRDSGERFETNAICTTTGAGAHCLGEGDTGEFTLSLQGDALRMQVTRLELEGLDGDLAQSDDRVFLIPPTRNGACGR